MKVLYKFATGYARGGVLRGIFVADDEMMAAAMGKEACFGEALGKFSDVRETLDDSNVTELTRDQDFIAKFEEYGCASGTNPLNYLPEEEG